MANITLHEIEIMRVDLVVEAPPVVVEVPTAPAGVIWSLATDAAFQGIAVGTTGTENVLGATPHISNAGSPTITIVESPAGGNGIRVSNRDADWHTLDILFESMIAELGMNLDANTYTLRVRGRVENPPANTTIDIMGTGGAWGRLNRPEPGGENVGMPLTGETFDTSAEFNAEIIAAMAGASAADRGRLRFAVGGGGEQSHYVIYEIEIRVN
jgi:hypothetical protein